MKNAGKDQNPFHAPTTSEGAQVPIEQHRAVQEVQAAMIIAKKFPRDQHAAFNRIMTACERSKLADAASYDYPKGGTMVTGPTIRLAEVMAQNWGNMEFGIRELTQDANGSEVQAFAWDLETNVRQSKTFVVPHKRKAHGSFKAITDPRDIYEHVANMGARRLRACILGVIPGDIVDAAVIKCEETLTKGDGKPIEDRVRDMLARFKEIEISQELIEDRLQHKTTAIVRSQLVELGKIYNSIKDGMSKRSDWFDVPKSQQSEASDLDAVIKEKAATDFTPLEETATKVEEKEEKPATAINCPYCNVNIKAQVDYVLESGGDVFGCPHCDKEGRIENGKPIGSYPPDYADRDKRGFDTWTNQDWRDWRDEWKNLREPGLSTYFHKNRAAFEAAPIELREEGRVRWVRYYPTFPWPLTEMAEKEDGLLDEIAKFPEATRHAVTAALSFDDLGRAFELHELELLLEKLKEAVQLSPEGEQLKAVNIEINKYPMKTVDTAQVNLELPTNRVLDLEESRSLLAECQRLTVV